MIINETHMTHMTHMILSDKRRNFNSLQSSHMQPDENLFLHPKKWPDSLKNIFFDFFFKKRNFSGKYHFGVPIDVLRAILHHFWYMFELRFSRTRVQGGSNPRSWRVADLKIKKVDLFCEKYLGFHFLAPEIQTQCPRGPKNVFQNQQNLLTYLN